jgi:hypothetical protein
LRKETDREVRGGKRGAEMEQRYKHEADGVG